MLLPVFILASFIIKAFILNQKSKSFLALESTTFLRNSTLLAKCEYKDSFHV